MTVYVDSGRWPLGRMRMAHMVADTLDELHAMAHRLGLRREWFQARASTPHYDVCQATRSRAIELGAIPVDRHGLVAVLRRLRSAPCPNRATFEDAGLTERGEDVLRCVRCRALVTFDEVDHLPGVATVRIAHAAPAAGGGS